MGACVSTNEMQKKSDTRDPKLYLKEFKNYKIILTISVMYFEIENAKSFP